MSGPFLLVLTFTHKGIEVRVDTTLVPGLGQVRYCASWDIDGESQAAVALDLSSLVKTVQGLIDA